MYLSFCGGDIVDGLSFVGGGDGGDWGKWIY